MIAIKKILKIHPNDNVVIALKELKFGEVIEIDNKEIYILNDVPAGHKVALENIKKGDQIIRYGYPIGLITENVEKGQWVHSHNLSTALKGKLGYNYKQLKAEKERFNGNIPVFKGYMRDDGKAGIRNEIWIINTVGCINKQTEKLAYSAEEKFKDKIDKMQIDGIYAFSHPHGCSQLGQDLENTRKLLAGLVKHPNAAGVLIVGLGCENNQLGDFKEIIGNYNPDRVKFLVLQDVKDGMRRGMDLIAELVNYAGNYQQKNIPVSELTIGLKCGGSDGFSGITGNPLVGKISDMIIDYGGSSILTEVPEMFGAEKILMDRARDRATFNKVVNLINDFKDFFIKNGQEIYENPSPGNKDGGITTLEEKSLGCIQKGGSREVADVLKYGEQVKRRGLTLLNSPGNDLVSTTVLTAAGAQIVLFTTGRGTPFSAPAPTIKISTNSGLYERKPNWIDFNAGQLLEGKTMDELSNDLFKFIIDLASKKIISMNEASDYRDIAILKTGVTL